MSFLLHNRLKKPNAFRINCVNHLFQSIPFIVFLFTLFFAHSIQAQQTKRVLFLGNSYTYTNDLPGTLKQLALTAGDTLIYDSNTPGGQTLEGHWANPTSIAKIKAGGWDYVVLQEQSQRPSFPQSQVEVEVYPYARLLDSLIHAHNPCAQTVFYMTWGRKYGDPSNCPFVDWLCTFNGMNNAIRYSYLHIANELGAIVAPVGSAWQRAMTLDADSTINLYVGDNSHPTPAGTYLAANVFYNTLFQTSSVGLPYQGGLAPADATFLQDVAQTVVFDSTTLWRTFQQAVTVEAQFTQSKNQLSFSAQSSKPVLNYLWNFDDGQNSTEANPTHTYTAPGDFVVTLTAQTDCGPAVAQLNLTVTPQDLVTRSTGGVLCAGQSRTLSATGGATFLWAPAEGLNQTQGPEVIASPAQTTVYTLTGVWGDEQPIYQDTFIVTVNPTPVISANLIALGGDSVQVKIIATNGTPPYQYKINDDAFQTDNIFVIEAPADVMLSVRDSNGCEAAELLMLTGREKTLATAPKVQIYPNPNAGNFNLQTARPIHLFIYNINGLIAYQNELPVGPSQISLSLPAGVYTARAFNLEKSYFETFRLIIKEQ